MHHLITYVLHAVFIGRGAHVPLPKPVSPHYTVQTTYHHEMPYVELSTLVEQRSLQVLLDDVGLLDAIEVLLLFLQDGVQLIYLINHSYTLTPIGQLPRLDDPNVLFAFL